MIDTYIEEYIRTKLIEAYPEIAAEQVIVKFPLAMLVPARDKRGAAMGREVLSVQIIVLGVEKLDRSVFIRQFPRQQVLIDSITVEQQYIKTEQKDFIEAVKNKGVIFTIQFTYDIGV